MSNVAERISIRLERVGLSAHAASLAAGLSRSAITDILAGNSNSPRLDTLEKLCGPLQCSIHELVSDQALCLQEEINRYKAEVEDLHAELDRKHSERMAAEVIERRDLFIAAALVGISHKLTDQTAEVVLRAIPLMAQVAVGIADATEAARSASPQAEESRS